MAKFSFAFLVLLILYLFIETAHLCLSQNSSPVECVEVEREALIKFKQGLQDPSLQLSSWQTTNCCRWKGVGCNTTTGHVIKLDLSLQILNVSEYDIYGIAYLGDFPNNSLVGRGVNNALLELHYLNHLDLSGVFFYGGKIPIPKFFGSMQRLTYLNLSGTGFSGEVPHQLGNLTNLLVLDIRSPYYVQYEQTIQNLEWISSLSSLQHLDMSGVNISNAQNLIQVLNMLPCLLVLRLSRCSLDNTHLSQSYTTNSSQAQPFLQNMTSLRLLDLSDNLFTSSIPLWFENLKSLVNLDLSWNDFEDGFTAIVWNTCKLKILDLSSNKFHGSLLGNQKNFSTCLNYDLEELSLSGNIFTGRLSDQLRHLKKLKKLDLKYNSFNGSIPTCIAELSALTKLNLAGNQLNGEIPDSLGQLLNLESLFLYNNSLEGIVSEVHFANLSRLKVLSIGRNQLVIKLKSNWLPPFQLEYIDMDSCNIGSQLPQWLGTQKEVYELQLSNASITGPIPQWFRQDMHVLEYLDLSYNQINGQFPTLPSTLITLDLSHNFIFGTLPQTISDMMHSLASLRLDNNLINGTIPNSFCSYMENLRALDISKNNLSGNIPSCWKEDNSNLRYIKLSWNKLTGAIPTSIGHLSALVELHLNNNNLEGELPLALRSCTSLERLNLGDNNFSGNIPKWIGESLSSLQVLQLRKNSFNDIIPSQICQLVQLQILDLAHNNIVGAIPHCFGNLSAMGVRKLNTGYYLDSGNVVEVMKGRELEYMPSILTLVVNMDLSSNNIFGMIPEELTLLQGLIGLNLSHNHLTGSIPKNLGNLTSLESLDLSINQLSGFIPQSISDITSLSYLNLSHNHLSGQIPTGRQLQTFNDPSIYAANPGLCGAPLPKKCQLGDEPPQAPMRQQYLDEEDKNEKVWFYMIVIVGYTTGLATVVGVLLLNKSWRFTYFRFVDQVKDWILLTIALNTARLKKQMGMNHATE